VETGLPHLPPCEKLDVAADFDVYLILMLRLTLMLHLTLMLRLTLGGAALQRCDNCIA
jgi:hypothetical protein